MGLTVTTLMSETFDPVRNHVLAVLKGGQAFDTFDDVLGEVPTHQRYAQAKGCGHSAWDVLEHMHRSLKDIVEFSDNTDGTYQEMNWPEDYWPKEKPDDEAWDKSRRGYLRYLEKLERMVKTGDLFTPFPWADGQTLMREALMAADHAAYHLGQIVLITRVLKSA